MNASDGAHVARLARAFGASVAAGAAMYWLVLGLALPALATRLSEARVEWLRAGFRSHPILVLGAVGLSAVVLALPVLGVFRLVYGPLAGSRLRMPSSGTP